jgi:ketosteroid isomerase-like protein
MAGYTDGEITVQMLWDLEQIKQLKARYFRMIDTKDWDGFRDLFTDDCVHWLPQESDRESVGNDEYLADMPRLLGNGITTHHGHMPEITLLGPTEAEGVWAMFDYVQVTFEDGTEVDLKGYGHYFETYRKCDDGKWRISSKRNTRLRLDRLK